MLPFPLCRSPSESKPGLAQIRKPACPSEGGNKGLESSGVERGGVRAPKKSLTCAHIFNELRTTILLETVVGERFSGEQRKERKEPVAHVLFAAILASPT